MTTTLTPTTPAIEPALREAIEEHVFSDTSREVGGVLIGRLEADRAVIEAHVPALRASSDAAHLTFTHDTWSQILDTVDRDFADQQIVGWYHSHPGHGVFLSGYDLFIQRSFFSDTRMPALVIDPLAGDAGWFGWAGDDIVEIGRSATDRAAVAAPGAATAGAPAPRRRTRTAAVVAVTGLLFATAGYAGGVAAVAGQRPARPGHRHRRGPAGPDRRTAGRDRPGRSALPGPRGGAATGRHRRPGPARRHLVVAGRALLRRRLPLPGDPGGQPGRDRTAARLLGRRPRGPTGRMTESAQHAE